MASSLITPSQAKPKKPTIGFVNLGCSKNQVDSEVMLGTLVALDVFLFYVFWELMLFVGILALAVVYFWRKGVFVWPRKVTF